IREVLYAEANPIRRRRLHARILEAIERIHADRLDAHATDLAHHAVQAGAMEKGFDYSLRAVNRSESVYAHDEARRYADLARECAEALGDRPRIVEAWRARSRVESVSGASAAAAAALVEALPWVDDADQRNAIEVNIGLHYVSVGDHRGLPHLESVMQRLDTAADPDLAARALSIRARYHHYDLEHERALELLVEARRLAAVKDNTGTLTSVMSYIAGAHQHMFQVDRSLAMGTELMEMGRARGNRFATALGHEFIGEAKALAGLWRESVAASEEVRRLGIEMGARDRIAWADFIAMYARFQGGRLRRSLADGRHGLELAVQIGELRLAALIAGYLTHILAELGERETWRAMADEATRLVEAAGQRWMHLLSRYCLAGAHLAEGDHVTATKILADPGLRQLGDNRAALIVGLGIRVECELAAGRFESALGVAEQLATLGVETKASFQEGIARRVAAQACVALGRWEEAMVEIRRAIALQESHDHQFELAKSRAALADMLDARRASGKFSPFENETLAEEAAAERVESVRLQHASRSGEMG
ncbi:MAG TPA: hypothetical protein VF720_16615, partial [Candidatus Eisenbacteria bacterium]